MRKFAIVMLLCVVISVVLQSLYGVWHGDFNWALYFPIAMFRAVGLLVLVLVGDYFVRSWRRRRV